jgi:hypothetical protein
MIDVSSSRIAVAVACGFAALLAFDARASADVSVDSDTAPNQALSSSCETSTAARLDFVAGRLDERRPHARRWWFGFTSFYAIGTVVTSYQAATEDDAGDRAVDIVSAVKAAFGTTRLYFFDRPAALHGGVPVRERLPDCQSALERGEELMDRAAHQSRSRYSWKRHASIVGINAAGALVAGEGWGERKDAWVSAGIGVVVGEIMAWTHPWNGARDLAEYEERHGDGPADRSRLQWQLLPTGNGLMVHARF